MGKVFELYRRAAMGNGDTGTPAPIPWYTILNIEMSISTAVVTVKVTVQNIGEGVSPFTVICTGYTVVNGESEHHSVDYGHAQQSQGILPGQTAVFTFTGTVLVWDERGSIAYVIVNVAPTLGQPANGSTSIPLS